MAATRSTVSQFSSAEAALGHATEKGRAAKAARLFILASLVGSLALLAPDAVRAQQAFEPRLEEPEEFPDFPGRDETFYFCIACHNFSVVAQQRMNRERWNATLDVMTARHGMPELDGEDRERILDYLEQAFPEADEAERGWKNPFLK